MELNTAAYNFHSENSPALDVAATEGCFLITRDGRRILDAAGGAIVVNIGHGRAEVAEAHAKALRQVDYVVPPFATEQRVRLVERLRDRWLPDGLRRIAFSGGGSEAMDSAIRLARRHHLAGGRPQRWRVLGRDLSYHGTTMATLAVGGHLSRRAGYQPWLVDDLTSSPRAVSHYCLRCPLGKSYPSCNAACADDVERAILEAGPDTVAAFVFEPIVGSNAGGLVPPDEYLPRVAEICRRHGVLMIADEVMTGCGRTGKKFGVDHWDIKPDILVCAKGLTSGYAPLSAICATDNVLAPIAEAGDDLMFFTYSGHSANCAVADKVLEILERENLVERAAQMGDVLRKKLEPLEDHPHVAQIRGRGLLQALEIVRDRDTLEPFPQSVDMVSRVTAAGLEHGAFFYPGGNDPARDVVCLGPPFTITEAEIDFLVGVLTKSIDQATQSASS